MAVHRRRAPLSRFDRRNRGVGARAWTSGGARRDRRAGPPPSARDGLRRIRYRSAGAARRASGATVAAPLDRVYFTNSGAEAIEGALKTARKHTRPRALRRLRRRLPRRHDGCAGADGKSGLSRAVRTAAGSGKPSAIRRRCRARGDRFDGRRGGDRAGAGRGRRAHSVGWIHAGAARTMRSGWERY